MFIFACAAQTMVELKAKRTHEEVKDRHVDDVQESVARVVGVGLLDGVAEERVHLPAGRHKKHIL